MSRRHSLTYRRHGLERGGSGGVWLPSQLTGLQDLYLGDAGKTLISGEVDVWADQASGALDMTAISATQRPLESLADANLGSQDVLSFIGATNDGLASAAAADFQWLHEGAASILGVWRKTSTGNGTIYDDNNGNAIALGTHFVHDVTNGRVIVRVCDGTAAVISIVSANTSVPSGAHVFAFRYDASAYDLRIDRSSLASGVPGTFGSGAPGGALRFGQLTGGTANLDGLVGTLIFCSGYLGDADVALFEAWATKYGV